MKLKKIESWQKKYKKIEALRAKGYSIQYACTYLGVAISTYHFWKNKIKK